MNDLQKSAHLLSPDFLVDIAKHFPMSMEQVQYVMGYPEDQTWADPSVGAVITDFHARMAVNWATVLVQYAVEGAAMCRERFDLNAAPDLSQFGLERRSAEVGEVQDDDDLFNPDYAT